MLTKIKPVKHILVILAALMLSIGANAQINLSLKNVKVSDAITALNRAQGYSVTVNSNDVDLNKVVSVNASGASINDVLDQIFAGQQVTYNINGKSISVSKGTPKAKAAQLTGVVLDEAGEPLMGAGIRVKGTTLGFISGLDGTFALNDVKFPATLIVSYIGYADQEIPVSGREGSIKVVFTESMNILDEVVVVGYGTQKRVNVTGAVSVIDGATLNQRPVTNTAMALQGADPSIVLTNGNGSIEGNEYSLNVRGKVSLNSGSPLVLVDGVEGSLTLVNPNDIESISVLKDASACAIYGAKASAGVILVTTKSGNGEEGRASINYNGRYSIASNTTSTDFMTCAYDYITMTNSFNQVFQGNDAWEYTPEQIQLMYDRRNDVTENPERPWVIPNETHKYTYLYLGNFDWYGYLFKRTRPEHEHNVSIKGGTKKMNYYVSGRYLYREGLFNQAAEDKINNYSVRSKLNAEITPWLHYSNNISFERSNYSYGGFWEQDGLGDTGVEAGILWNTTQNVGPFYVPFNPDGTVNIQPGYMYGATSPLFSGRGGVWMTESNRNARIKNALTLTNRLTFSIAKGLKFVADYTYRRNDNVETYRSLPTANCYDNANNRMYVGNGLTGGNFSNGSVYDFYREIRYYQDGHIVNGYFSYNGDFGKHNVAATLGTNFDDYRNSKLTAHQKGSLSDVLAYINLASATEISTLSESNSSYRTLGFFGRLNYNYAEKYLFELSGRYDGTSRFPKNHRWGFFPSASAGWRISEEPFWEPLKGTWNKAKLRLSYGTLGNQQVSNYYYFDTISLAKLGYTFNATDAAQRATMSSPVSSSLTWETVISYNVGLDLGFLKDRLNITADAYIRDTKDMLTKAMTLPNVYGESAPKENAADLRTTGYEIAVSWHDAVKVGGKPLHYGITATLGDNITKITKFNNPTNLLTDNYVGKTLGEIWGYHVIGLFESDEAAAEWAKTYDLSVVNKAELACKAPYNQVMAGDMQFENLDGDAHMKDGKIAISTGSNTLDDPGDRKVIGNSLPRYRYSFKGDLAWNGIDFSFFFQGVGKCDWYPDANCVYFWGPYSYRRATFIPTTLQANCWSEDNTSGYFPRQRAQLVKNSVVNDRYLQNAAYLRLKNITLGYTIPFKTKAIQKCRLYFSGENLFYLSPMRKYCNTVDPEVATTSAYGDCLYPYAKTVTMGVDITF